MNAWLRAFRQILRALWRAPAFTFSVAFCLGLGIAASAVVVAIVDAFLLRPLPFHEPSRLVAIWKTSASAPVAGQRYSLAPSDFLFLREEAGGLTLAALQPDDVDVTGGGEPQQVIAARTSGNFFSVLGVPPLTGRLLTAEDESTEAAVAVVGSSWARQRYGEAAAALGESLTVDDRTLTVVGVVAEGTGYPNGAEMWLPLTRQEYEARRGVSVIGRLNDGSSPAAAAEEVRALGRRLREVNPNLNAEAGLGSDRLQRFLTGKIEPTLLALLGAVGCLTLIAGTNAASLVFARAQAKISERRMRQILGASRWRLFWENAAQALVLATLSSAIGLLLARLALPPLLALSPLTVLTFAPIHLSGRTVLFVFALTLLSTLAFAAMPAAELGLKKPSLSGSTSGRRLTGGRRKLSWVVMTDIALTTVLLTGAGLILQTVRHLTQVDPGFVPEGLTTIGVSVPPAFSGDQIRRAAFFEQLVSEVASLPGVEGAAAVSKLPMTQPERYLAFNIEGRPPKDAEATELELFRVVTPGYFRTLGLPLIEGRAFTRGDHVDAPPVAVVNASFAKQFWPDGSPIGRRIKRGQYYGDGGLIEIVGVVGDSRERGLVQPLTPALYLPYPQWDRSYLARGHLAVRTDLEAASLMPAIRERTRAIDARAVLFRVEPMASVVARSMRQQDFLLTLLAIFASMALVQAAAGLYGLVSYDVHSRTREIGIRMALGARPDEIWKRIVGFGALRATAGLAVGLVAAFVSASWSQELWFGVEATDARTYLAVCVVTGVTVLLATYLPAHRAARLDPARTLHGE